jgi:hypothetical protein
LPNLSCSGFSGSGFSGSDFGWLDLPRTFGLNGCCEEAAGPGVPRKALNAQEEKRVDRQHDSEEELASRSVVGSEVVGSAEHEKADDQ